MNKEKEVEKILFVCLGNICRSSTAEGIMRKLLAIRGIEDKFVIDSAGLIRHHEGELPDPRMRKHASLRGYNLIHRSRPICAEDFEIFDLILAMDDSVYDRLKDMAPTLEDEQKVERMSTFCVHFPDADHIPDPYYGGAEGFEYVMDLLEDGCKELLSSRLPSSLT